MTDAHRFSSDTSSGPPGLTAWGRAFGIASLLHLTLPDVQEPGWIGPAVLEAVGALWLLYRPAASAFALCALGTALPLLLLRDVLTQSMYLTWAASLGCLAALGRAGGFRDAIRLLTAGTYLLATVHKLNTGFLDPSISCANHAVAQFVDRWAWLSPVEGVEGVLPVVTLGVELLLAWLVFRGSSWMWLVGLVFHLPLTVTLAPAFGPVVMSGYVAAIRPRDAVTVRWIWARRKGALVLGGLLVLGLDVVSTGALVGPILSVKLLLAGAIGAGGVLLVWGGAKSRPPRAGMAARVVLAAWLLHGLTPYFGIQYQHTGAMLSNLRVDVECHNSLVFPRAMVGLDPYLRVTSARIGQGQRAAREKVLESSLWNVAALHTMRRNWCRPHLRPIALKGTWRGRAFAIDDLCDDAWISALPGAQWLPAGFQRFQKNLPRACAAACIH